MSCPEYPKIDTLYERDDSFKVDEDRIRRPEFAIPGVWLVTEKIDGTNVRVSLESNEEKVVMEEPDEESHRPTTMYKADPWAVRFYGRTAKAQMPTFLLEYLQKTFTVEGLKSLWRCKPSCECLGEGKKIGVAVDIGTPYPPCPNLKPYPITLYGEGYGARIQKGGGNYRRDGDVSFRLFDVLIGGIWLRRADVEDIAVKLGIKCVPLFDVTSPVGRVGLPTVTIAEIVSLVKGGFDSTVAEKEGTSGHQAEGVVAFTEEPLFNSRGQRLMFKLKTADFA